MDSEIRAGSPFWPKPMGLTFCKPPTTSFLIENRSQTLIFPPYLQTCLHLSTSSSLPGTVQEEPIHLSTQ